MDLSIMLPPHRDDRWQLAEQLDLDAAVVRFWGVEEPWWDRETLQTTADRFAAAGLPLAVVEDRPPMTATVLGREGRDEEIAEVKRLIENMGAAGIDTYCWVWTEHPLGVLRTGEYEDRGGSRQTGYDHDWMERRGAHPAADVTEEDLWENLAYFLDEVVPVAEAAGVNLALHPDDPPISPIRGVPRIVKSIEDYERILSLHESRHHGVTFCQGNFSAMGVDVPAAIRRLGEHIRFVHFRDVAGTPDSFVETWHDDGQTDMRAAMDAYRDVGFDGPIRPDHVPTLAGDLDSYAGGRLYSVGYMRGLLD